MKRKFKIGDKIKILPSATSLSISQRCVGNTYEINSFGSGSNVYLFFDGQTRWSISEPHFVLVSASSTTSHTFKVGDKVSINKDSEYFGQHAGVGKIDSNFGGGSHQYQVKWSDGYTNQYRATDLDLHEGQSIDQPTPTESVVTKTECDCPKHVWMNEGCKCGAITPYKLVIN